ncbi:hypothetical protein AVEN_264335-1 [Araneus ventricosus]|uniref:DNA-directed DNA polymerase n=1 Tax=Araneus ventricosus TaxID=182803 RepID=A0A4Y2H766_ARAVE|nr:hypothetical protein AVEN_264335-1 [Araneus ventricosus]
MQEKQTYVGPLPDASCYSPYTMSPGDRKAFFQWYERHKNDTSEFKKEMLMYCRSDADILRRCCAQFRKQFLKTTGVDPFTYVTIVSSCMAAYRSNHITENTNVMVPIEGYVAKSNYSQDSIRWLDFVTVTEGIKNHHALNGREQNIERYFVDGFCPENNRVYQYHASCIFLKKILSVIFEEGLADASFLGVTGMVFSLGLVHLDHVLSLPSVRLRILRMLQPEWSSYQSKPQKSEPPRKLQVPTPKALSSAFSDFNKEPPFEKSYEMVGYLQV